MFTSPITIDVSDDPAGVDRADANDLQTLTLTKELRRFLMVTGMTFKREAFCLDR